MKSKKLLCFILSVIFLLGAINPGFSLMSVVATPGTDYDAEIGRLDNEIAALEKEQAALAGDIEKEKEYLSTLQDQIDAIESKANALQSQINELNSEIEKLTKQYNQLKKDIDAKTKSIAKATALITQTEANIATSSDMLASKLRAAYMQGEESTVEVLMGADSLASFLTRLEMMKRSSESSKKTIDDFKQKVTTLKKTRTQLENDKKELAEKQEKVVTTRETYVEKKNVLISKQSEFKASVKSIESKYKEVEEKVASLAAKDSDYSDQITALQAQKDEADAAREAWIKNYYGSNMPNNNESSGEGSSSGGGGNYYTEDTWAWPLGSYGGYITSDYGYRESIYGTNPFHGGIDLSGGGYYGTGIYAARAGTVVKSADTDDGYGYSVMIDHGDGYMTLYAHNSQNVVSVGEYVTKGQLVAYGGSSGISTGPHLHFGIYYYGETVNPSNFYSY